MLLSSIAGKVARVMASITKVLVSPIVSLTDEKPAKARLVSRTVEKLARVVALTAKGLVLFTVSPKVPTARKTPRLMAPTAKGLVWLAVSPKVLTAEKIPRAVAPTAKRMVFPSAKELPLVAKDKVTSTKLDVEFHIKSLIPHSKDQTPEVYKGKSLAPNSNLGDQNSKRKILYGGERQQSKLAVTPKTRVNRSGHWKPPSPSDLKMNVDTSVVQGADHCGIGIVIWDDIGMIVVAATCKVPENFNVFLAECFAVREGFQLCIDLNIGVS
ncbi:hypothetical protein TorRG33x02_190180 [Trema orientale]|uniref:RNase H type-1 domain-containing protein n=1 Tax=Trema orientale TaxID=63057 RepID=A0A2P5EI43_TREOI|nr:hypothetical protein TorRG33x02_190180 [Trema orientale]